MATRDEREQNSDHHRDMSLISLFNQCNHVIVANVAIEPYFTLVTQVHSNVGRVFFLFQESNWKEMVFSLPSFDFISFINYK